MRREVGIDLRIAQLSQVDDDAAENGPDKGIRQCVEQFAADLGAVCARALLDAQVGEPASKHFPDQEIGQPHEAADEEEGAGKALGNEEKDLLECFHLCVILMMHKSPRQRGKST